MHPQQEPPMSPSLLNYYEAIEQASADMLHAARSGDWDQVVKLEGACVLLISQLKQAARRQATSAAPSRASWRILLNDAEVRHLAEPWLPDLHRLLQGKANKSGSTLH
jgi:flagellar protein FliT